MAVIAPFDALQYNTRLAGSPDTLCCPPYDIVSEEGQDELERRNPYNAIRLERPRGDGENGGGKSPYQTAAGLLSGWKQAGILCRDGDPCLYAIRLTFPHDGTSHTLNGLVARVKLEEFENNVILPHENTLAKAKEDRMALLRATHCQFSSIYGLYPESSEAFGVFGEPDVSFTMPDGILHEMRRISMPSQIKMMQDFFADKQIFIADGHHRYETALAFRRSLVESGETVDEDHPANYIMFTLVSMADPGLIVLPTHRVLSGLAELPSLETLQSVCHIESADHPVTRPGAVTYYAGGETYYSLSLKSPLDLPDSEAYRSLDVVTLHEGILRPCFGITPEMARQGEHLTYVQGAQESIRRVREGEAQCAFILNATQIGQIRDVSLAGEKMPQKSTYFYPKLITGLIMNEF